MRLFQIVKRVTEVIAGGTAQWLGQARPALALSAVLDARGTEVRPGISATTVIPAYSSDLTTRPAVQVVATASGSPVQPSANPALALSTVNSGAATYPFLAPALALLDQPSGVVKPAQNPAFQVVSRVDSAEAAKPAVSPALFLVAPLLDNRQTPQNPAADIVQVQFNLTYERGGVTATAVGAWTTATNAQGDKNATNARAAGELGATTKSLRLDYADLVNKSTMTITEVALLFYSKLTLAALNDCTVLFERSLDNGGAWTTLATVTADYDELVAGRTFVLSPLPTLAQVQAMQARMTVSFPAVGQVKTLDIDAIHLRVTANETWTL